MALHRPFLALLVFGLVLALVGCSLPGAPSVTAAAPAPLPTVTPTKTACTNPLFPVVKGAQWTYSIAGISTGTFTHTILAVRPDGFTDQDVFNSGVTRTGEWGCQDGALSALNPAESLSAMIQFDDFTADYRTTSSNGVTLPAILTPGTAWSQDFTMEGSQNVSGQEVPATGKVSYACKAADTETVVVPAGALEAVRIGCQINGTVSVSMLGFDVPTELTSVTTLWYARGIGMIKTENEVSGIGHTSIELTSYNIP